MPEHGNAIAADLRAGLAGAVPTSNDLAAGPDEIRRSAPYHGIAYESAWN